MVSQHKYKEKRGLEDAVLRPKTPDTMSLSLNQQLAATEQVLALHSSVYPPRGARSSRKQQETRRFRDYEGSAHSQGRHFERAAEHHRVGGAAKRKAKGVPWNCRRRNNDVR